MGQSQRGDTESFSFKELVIMVLLLVFGEVVGVGGYFFTRDSSAELSKMFAEGAITLFFGALLGGVVALLIADFDRRRLRRAAQLDFSSNVLADLKSVYDRVDRGRILIHAHKSAKTYGEEMRNFIEARVKLLNVVRALKSDERGASLDAILTSVDSMEQYLKALIEEYEQNYKEISQSQSLYELRMKHALEKSVAAPDVVATLPKNAPWDAIAGLTYVKDFMAPVEKCDPNTSSSASKYSCLFLHPLDDASKRLRRILRDKLV